MQTLQAAKTMLLRVIPWNEFDRPTVYRIVDQDGNHIAKVNGPGNLPIMLDIIKTYNECVALQKFIRARLMDILKELPGTGEFVVMLREAARKGLEKDVIQVLKDQYKDAPEAVRRYIGDEAALIVEIITL